MRKLLLEVAKSSDYNISSSYGKLNNCEVPDSCTTGSKLFITYGHFIDVDAATRNSANTLVSMFREPVSWLISRWKHAYKFSNQKMSLVDAAVTFGQKYFSFADSETRGLLSSVFEQTSRNGMAKSALQGEIQEAIERTARLFKNNCVVLLYEPYNRSVNHLSDISGNDLFLKLFSEKYSRMSINSAPKDQYVDKMMAEVSEKVLKDVNDIMFLHTMVYRAAVLEFSDQIISDN